MYKRFAAVAAAVVVSLSASTVLAQCGCGPVQTTYAPIVPSHSTYYAPMVTNYVPAPRVTYYAPARPYAAYYAPARPYAAYYAPARPYATYYAPAVQPYMAYYGAPGWSVFGTPKIYVPGQPVLNVLRAATP